MANEIWIKTLSSPSATSTGQGSGTNDGWLTAATYPRSSLPQSTTQRLAVYVTGRVGITNYATGDPLFVPGGQIEVCLGLSSGLKSTKHRLKVPINGNVDIANTPGVGLTDRGLPFTFMLVQQASPSISDSDFGATLNTTAMGDLVLWARTYRNGDPASYWMSFDIFDTQWLVMDMDALAADSRVRAAEDTSTTSVDATVREVLTDGTNIGSATQKWITFAQVAYDSGVNNDFKLRIGYQTSSGATATGTLTTRLELGHSSGLDTGLESPKSQQGGFFTHTIASGTQHMQMLGVHQLIHSSATTVTRAATLSIRVDDLGYFSQAAITTTTVGGFEGMLLEKGSAAGTPPYNGQSPGYYPVLMESATSTGTWHPIILAQSQTNLPPYYYGETTTKIQLRNGTGGIVNEHEGWQHQLEGAFNVSTHGYQRSMNQLITQTTAMAEIAYSFSMDVRTRDIQTLFCDLQWPCMLMFHDTLNANNNTPTPKWTDLTPTPITITAEGPVVGSMNALPFAPDDSIQQTMEQMQFGEVKGTQGYRRTWPTWVKPRRGWSLTWNPLSEANATTLRTFLNANDSFAFTPPGYSSAIPVMITSEVGSTIRSDGLESIRCEVTELLFTA